jgi:hypothetical protein
MKGEVNVFSWKSRILEVFADSCVNRRVVDRTGQIDPGKIDGGIFVLALFLQPGTELASPFEFVIA